MNVNLDKYFDEQKPTITVFGKTYEVDNDYKKVLGMQELAKGLKDDPESMEKILEYGLIDGKKAAKEILPHKFSFEFFENIQLGIMAAMTGKPMEVVKKSAEKQLNDNFRG